MALSDCDAPTGAAASSAAVPSYGSFGGWVQEKWAPETFAVTLDAAPTNGNFLIAFGFKDDALPAVNTGAGWSSVATHSPEAQDPYAVIAIKGPCSGEAAAQTPFSGTAGGRAGVVVMEIAGITATSQVSASFDGSATTGNATTTVSAATEAINTLALAFSGWEAAGPVSFTLALDASWSGSNVSNVNGDDQSFVAGRQLVANAGAIVTATTTTGVASYGLTGALVLIKPVPTVVWTQASAAPANPNTTALQATEALSAGNLVNIYSGGMRKASKTLGREAHGYVIAAVANGAYATPQFDGKITGLVGLTIGPVYLSSSGGISSTPGAAPDLLQQVGIALSATEVVFLPQMPGVAQV